MKKQSFVCLMLAFILFAGSVQAKKNPERVVFIALDGISVDGYKKAHVPNLDALKQHGVVGNDWVISKHDLPAVETDAKGYTTTHISYLHPIMEASTKVTPKRLKVMSYNIHYGQGMDEKYDLERIAKVIVKENPDLVGLQEIGDSVMAAKLGELTGMKFVFGPSQEKMNGYGDAILSKYPFTWVGNYSIPSASSSRYQAMAVDVDLSGIYEKGTTIRFINTHLDWLKTLGSEAARLAAVDVIEEGFFGSCALPAILTGDLNAAPESGTLSKLKAKGWINESMGKALYTIRSFNPTKQIDYVLLRPQNKWKVTDVYVLDEPVASDHLPIVMTLIIDQ